MPVVVQNKKASDTSHIWLIVSRATAAVLGGFVVTYWTGAAVAKTAMAWDLLSRANAGMFSGLVQLVVYVALIIWVCANGVDEKSVVGPGHVDRAARRCHRVHAGTPSVAGGRMGDRRRSRRFSDIGTNSRRQHTP